MKTENILFDPNAMHSEYMSTDDYLTEIVNGLRSRGKTDSHIIRIKSDRIEAGIRNVLHDLEFLAQRLERNQNGGKAITNRICEIMRLIRDENAPRSGRPCLRKLQTCWTKTSTCSRKTTRVSYTPSACTAAT